VFVCVCVCVPREDCHRILSADVERVCVCVPREDCHRMLNAESHRDPRSSLVAVSICEEHGLVYFVQNMV
jgi:hypothetical protein